MSAVSDPNEQMISTWGGLVLDWRSTFTGWPPRHEVGKAIEAWLLRCPGRPTGRPILATGLPYDALLTLRNGFLRVIILALIFSQAGCASRPDAGVLVPAPVVVREDYAEKVRIIAATNRQIDAERIGYTSSWAAATSFEIFDLSVPSERHGIRISYPSRGPDPKRQYVVQSRKAATTAEIVNELVRSPKFDGSSGIFVHGYNFTYQEALFRTAQVAADAKIKNAPILFSWPSAASMTGYVADRDSVLSSRSALTDLVETLADAPGMKQIVLFGHSMGGFLVMETVRQLKLEGRQDVLRRLAVILASPDIDVDVFRSQLEEVGSISSPITLLVAKTDRALSVSSMLARERARVGQMSVDDPRLKALTERGILRVIDITAVEAGDGFGHDRYATLAKFGTRLLSLEAAPFNREGQMAFVFDPTKVLDAGTSNEPTLQND